MNRLKLKPQVTAGLILIALLALTFFLPLKNNTPEIVNSADPRCHTEEAPYRNPLLPVPERVNDLMSRMSDAEKIGQMTMVEKNSLPSADVITQYKLGSVISGFGGKPDPNTPLAWLDLINEYQRKALATCLKIPILYGVDAIHGFTNVVGGTVFPHFIGLGATGNSDLIKAIGKATADEMTAVGIYWNFAPNIDVAQDTRWGRTYETFGSDPKNVSDFGLAYLKGFQSSSNTYLNAIGTLKHFVGTGAMQWGSSGNKNFRIDQGNAIISEASLRQRHLPAFKKGIDGGAKVVMVGLGSINGDKMSANKYLITDVLKTELKFDGIALSDWYGVYEVSRSKYLATVSAVNAGIDMVMLPFDYKIFTNDMNRAVQRGDISENRLNDAVRRILTVKFELGLFDRPVPSEEGLSVIGNATHRELARQAVRESQVILKNQADSLPLSTSANWILVAGSGGDNLGRQSGGWTVEWQGIDGNWIPGTTILSAIKNTVSETTRVDYDLVGEFPHTQELADVGIAIISEKPYAEGLGDNSDPRISDDDLAAIERLKAQSQKLVVVIISGRPLTISKYINTWDAAVASWLPGTEGQGVADVLFGLYPFTGTLPVNWNY